VHIAVPLALKFRLYPNADQEKRMIFTINTCRGLWNDALAQRKLRWERGRRSTTYNLQARILTADRKCDPRLGGVHSQVVQDVLRRLDRAIKRFFGHRTGYPKFKKYSESGSFTYPQAYNGSVKPDPLRKRLFLSKIGNVKAVFHRPLPMGPALLKTCTVVREPCGEWFSCLVYGEVVPLHGVKVTTGFEWTLETVSRPPVGIDLGLKALITTSDGMSVAHPKFLRKAEKRLKHLQRIFSGKKKGARNRWKARQRVATLHTKVARQRADFNHKLSTQLVRDHELVAFEDLKVRNMVRNHSLAKAIQDAGWSQLVRFSAYKAAENGGFVAKVDPTYSTQECFFCGALNRVTLSMREFACVGCGRVLKRDLNAARVMLKRALVRAKVGQDRRPPSDARPDQEHPDQVVPELMPAEVRPLSVLATGRANMVVEAGTGSTGLGRWRMSPRGRRS